jgi:hypothetical protein
MASRYDQVVGSDQTSPDFGFTELNSGLFSSWHFFNLLMKNGYLGLRSLPHIWNNGI